MSFPKKGKFFPKRGGDGSSDFSLDDHAFAMKIGSALKAELKDRNSRAKLVAGWTGANERTVKIGFQDGTPPAAGTSWFWLGIQTRC